MTAGAKGVADDAAEFTGYKDSHTPTIADVPEAHKPRGRLSKLT
jgi:hypothetical protein